jgi:hypothetical protein
MSRPISETNKSKMDFNNLHHGIMNINDDDYLQSLEVY